MTQSTSCASENMAEGAVATASGVRAGGVGAAGMPSLPRYRSSSGGKPESSASVGTPRASPPREDPTFAAAFAGAVLLAAPPLDAGYPAMNPLTGAPARAGAPAWVALGGAYRVGAEEACEREERGGESTCHTARDASSRPLRAARRGSVSPPRVSLPLERQQRAFAAVTPAHAPTQAHARTRSLPPTRRRRRVGLDALPAGVPGGSRPSIAPPRRRPPASPRS